ncbi:hypothetical protein Nepgr_002668 [Nepenthes gracilis]|uniref:Transmembrane protein n=1 Tax=Nepenthes gracilis TaxID=150966 RepID=A0AAD3RXZ3_NEPGR|nr:hypothetical protein Nepgr_002668 [Nepenthes gracilis]
MQNNESKPIRQLQNRPRSTNIKCSYNKTGRSTAGRPIHHTDCNEKGTKHLFFFGTPKERKTESKERKSAKGSRSVVMLHLLMHVLTCGLHSGFVVMYRSTPPIVDASSARANA